MTTLQIVLLSFVLLFLAIVSYRALYRKVVVQQTPGKFRMLVAIRRRGSALEHYLKLSGEEKIDLVRTLTKLLHMLHERWLASASFVGGFSGDVQGLPAGSEYDWMILVIYRISDYQHFQRCASMLEEAQFEPLRYYLEIRFLFGTSNTELSERLSKLF